MNNVLKMKHAAMALALAIGMPHQIAHAGPAQAGSAAAAANKNKGSAAEAAEAAEKQKSASIPSTNPDDANKHPAYRKRQADSHKADLPALRKSMKQNAQ